MTSHPRSIPVVLSVFVLLLAGCAGTTPKPTSDLDAANAAITEAESAGARDTDPVLLNGARDKVNDARRLIDQEQYAQARRTLERATADARLAKARANTVKARQAVEELNETIEMLRERLQEDQA